MRQWSLLELARIINHWKLAREVSLITAIVGFKVNVPSVDHGIHFHDCSSIGIVKIVQVLAIDDLRARPSNSKKKFQDMWEW